MEFDLYKDIQKRTNGEIYIGVVGPVRTGKSTFIKRFMDLFVLPYIEDEEEKKRTLDELPQSAAGKTIMTTEPKFIPQEAAEITLADESSVSVRLIDCVGFMVEGANGHLEGDGYRMVHTPWFEEEIPFSDAARIGTEKVIKDHATIGIVVTTDGSIGELPRENYVEAEQTAVEKLKEIGKPYVIVLNSVRPYSSETLALKESLEQEYQAVVVPVNCQQMHREDLVTVMKAILFEFPVTRVDFAIPKWTEMLPMEHKLKAAMIQTASRLMDGIGRVRDAAAVLAGQEWVKSANEQMAEEVFRDIQLQTADLSNGTVTIRMETTEQCYFSYISEMTGMQIEGEYQMISMLQGKAHQVYTGVTLLIKKDGKKIRKTFHECSDVHVYPMSKEEIREYIATGEPMDKAGAYGIQGAFGVYICGIEGDYNTIVGLPLARVYQEMKKYIY